MVSVDLEHVLEFQDCLPLLAIAQEYARHLHLRGQVVRPLLHFVRQLIHALQIVIDFVKAVLINLEGGFLAE